MRKIFSLFSTCLFVASVSGCNSDDGDTQNQLKIDETSTEKTLNRVAFDTSKGIQTDVLNQRIEVINSASSYNDFWLSISSMSGNMPPFDENSETMIGIISNAQSCIYSPIVTGVKESDATITISILNNPSNIPEQAVCDPLPFEFYAYNIVNIGKTNKPISIVFESSSVLSCDSPIDVSGNTSTRLIIAVKEGQDVDAIAEEYQRIYGSDISIHRVLEHSRVFSAEMEDTVLLNLRCDERIEDIDYDEPVSVAS